MGCAECGQDVPDGSRFCPSCGRPTTSTGSSTPDVPVADPVSSDLGGGEMDDSDDSRGSGELPTPVVPVAASPPPTQSGDEHGAPSGSGRRKVVLVLVAVLLLVVGAAVWSAVVGDGSSNDRYVGPNTDLVYLANVDRDGVVDELTFVSFGSDDRPTTLGPLFVPAQVGRSTDVGAVGGPIVGVVSSFDDDDDRVIVADRDSGEVTTLLDGSSTYVTRYVPGRDLLLAVEFRDSGSRCFAGRATGPLERVARGDGCSFSEDGEYVLSWEIDGEIEYVVSDLAGAEVLVGAATSVPRFAAFSGALVVTDGGNDRQSVAIVEIETGTILAESARGADVSVLDESTSGHVLVGVSDGEGEASLERLGRDGEVVEVLTTQGSVTAGFVVEEGDRVAAITSTDAESTLSLIDLGNGESILSDEFAATDIDLWLPTVGDRTGAFTAVLADDDADVVVLVGLDDGVVEIDVDDFVSLEALMSGDGSRLFLSVLIDETDSVTELITVDLVDGTFDRLLDDWANGSVVEVTRDGSAVLFVGKEDAADDDRTLVHVDLDGDVEFVVDEEYIFAAVFGRRGDTVLYAAGSGDEVDVYEYELGSRVRPALLYSDAYLAGVGWQGPSSPRLLVRAERFEVRSPLLACSAAADGTTSLVVGETVESAIDAYGTASFCLVVPTSGVVEVSVSSGFDSTLSIEGPYDDPDTSFINRFNDDFDGLDAAVFEYLEAGVYLVTVGGYEESSGPFDLVTD